MKTVLSLLSLAFLTIPAFAADAPTADPSCYDIGTLTSDLAQGVAIHHDNSGIIGSFPINVVKDVPSYLITKIGQRIYIAAVDKNGCVDQSGYLLGEAIPQVGS